MDTVIILLTYRMEITRPKLTEKRKFTINTITNKLIVNLSRDFSIIMEHELSSL
jgi:hypothetical protein